MDKMIGGFNDRAEIAAESLYPSAIDGNCTKQEIFLEGATWAFNRIHAVLADYGYIGKKTDESDYWVSVIYEGLIAPVTMDDMIVGNRAKED